MDKWREQRDIHDESILPEELRPCREESTETKKLELYQCDAKCCYCYNIFPNFGLHQNLDPMLVLYIVLVNIEIHFMCFILVFWSLLRENKNVVFSHVKCHMMYMIFFWWFQGIIFVKMSSSYHVNIFFTHSQSFKHFCTSLVTVVAKCIFIDALVVKLSK